ncbi:AAA family ATPase [Lapillicoccus sp.]|uniref:AAA family ATPase n=1 Tax=Lapillicoccus sp. TaxID=1909287 RepID=UPI0027CCAEEE|nr:AAA family ATPase [Actinomycetota bacterium]
MAVGRASSWMDPLPVRRIVRREGASLPADRWPLTLAPIAQLLDRGLDLGRSTVLVGENGAGKSTLVEAIAIAYGLSREGGSTGARHSTYASESPLHDAIALVRGAGASRWGYFLRAETTHGLFTYLHDNPGDRPEPDFHALSHGESFLAMLGTERFDGKGLFVLDEPEAGLSFTAQLALVGSLHALTSQPGRQVLLATHSPVLAALPGTTILQLDDTGIRETRWEDLDVVDHYQRFLDAPQRYLRHIVDEG